MGRVIIRRGARNVGSDGTISEQPIGIEQPNPDTVGNDIESRTGEPDSDDIGSTSNDNPSSKRVDGNGPQFVDPTSATGGTADGTPKRRGRKPGSKNRTTRNDATKTTQDLSRLLFSVHIGMASMLKSPVWMLTEQEATNLGEAITRVTELYDISIIPEKQLAWLNLIMVGGTIYGPRIVMTGKKKQPQSKPQVITMQQTHSGDEQGVI